MEHSNFERETIINFNATQEDASVFTAQPGMWRRFEKIGGFKLVRTERLGGRVCGKEFECPKAYVRPGKNGLMIGRTKAVSQKQREQGKELARRKGVKAIP